MSNTRRNFLQLLLGRCASAAVVLGLAITAPLASAQGYGSWETARAKLSVDLNNAIGAPSVANLSWAKETLLGGRLVKVLVIAEPGTDPELAGLRSAIVAAGGSVYYRYISVSGVLALLPANKVVEIARRGDVQSISPNRSTYRTQSLLEQTTGAATARATPATADVDGRGVGIAFLDSGIMASHRAFADANGGSRVKRSVDIGRAQSTGLLGLANWTKGVDYSRSMYPGTSGWSSFESAINVAGAFFQDPNGHGTLVASIAAGGPVPGAVESTGVASGASVYDVRVLDSTGEGDIATALAGIDWVIVHGRDYNLRVLNMSLAADSTESAITDPLCRAVRNAVASGITVVVAAGNYGLGADNVERYGTVSSPGHEPSAITVGSANAFATANRADDAVNRFSSRGPTRGAFLKQNGQPELDNLLKPDLVAPGNRVPAALSTDVLGLQRSRLSLDFPQLVVQTGPTGEAVMRASGTSFSAPVVSATAALMLQVNPGLTPPLVKAILQFTAEPLANFNLLQQGAGLVNVPGALALAGTLATDISARVEAGTIKTGDSILAPGKSMPAPTSTIEGRSFYWSSILYMGGNQVLAGTELFTRFQASYDPKVSWIKQRVRRTEIDTLNGSIVGFDELNSVSRRMVSNGVKSLTQSLSSGNGILLPVPVISAGALGSMGIVLLEGVVLSDGVVLLEGVALMEGLVLLEGLVMMEGISLMEGVVLFEGLVMLEGSGNVFTGE